MNHKKIILLIIASFIVLLAPITCKSQEKVKEKEKTVQGMVKIYGNEPHTWVGIETIPAGKIYFVSPPEKAVEIRNIQGLLLEFTVIIRDTQMPGVAGTATLLSWRIIR